MARIKEVNEYVAKKYGIQPGDEIISVDNKPIKDYIDFLYYTSEEKFSLKIKKQNNSEVQTFELVNKSGNIGITLDGIIFDRFRTCGNRCIFCFVDQGGPVKRSSLKIKDDDYRFSFLQGSFITLTNLTRGDLDRIKRLKISPLYVSVHATDPKVRTLMMGNPGAGRILSILKELIQAGISFHTQIVVCPGYNDGKELENSINDLYKLGEGILSIGVVPVGLTRYRNGLTPLKPVTEEKAGEILTLIKSWQEKFYKERGSRVLFAADEFYALSKTPLPSGEEYEDYPQLENGIGLTRLFREESFASIKEMDATITENVGIITSKLGAWAWEPVINKLKNKGVIIEPLISPNSFFGPRISVSGLLAGSDLLDISKDKKSLPSLIFLPGVMFNEQGKTLDGYTLADIREHFSSAKIEVAFNLEDLLNKIKKHRGESQ